MQGAESKIQAAAIECVGVKVAQGHGIKAASLDFRASVSIAGGFGHLLPIGQQVLSMDPIIDEWLAGKALALGDLVFVMGKDIIHATGVYVEMIAKVLY